MVLSSSCISSANILKTYKQSLYSSWITEWTKALAVQAKNSGSKPKLVEFNIR